MSAEDERRARLTAQFDQAGSEGRAMASEPEVADVAVAWAVATERMANTMLKAGIAPDGLLGAILGPTAELVMKVRDSAGGP